jgi:hypothetical protein
VGEEPELAAAWRAFCLRLSAVGESITGPDYPQSTVEQAEGFRYLANLAVFALQWHLDFSDPEFPAFFRYDDDVVKWGGPNSDNNYLRAKVAGSGAYRITGNVAGVRDLIVSVHEGDMALGKFGVFAECNLADLQVSDDGAVEIVVSTEQHAGNWLALHPDADHIVVRQYLSDWDADPLADLAIERIGNEGRAPEPRQPSDVGSALEKAATWVERSVVFWSQYLNGIKSTQLVNELGPPQTPPGGSGDILYGGGCWDLTEEQALVIECDVPAARYWSIQLYNDGWFESLDIANRLVSLSGHQMHVDDDGRFRVVVSARDPRTPNWLDTQGLRTGLISYRWVHSTTAPSPVTQTTTVAAVQSLLPQSPQVTPEGRREQVHRRQAAIARRFRR